MNAVTGIAADLPGARRVFDATFDAAWANQDRATSRVMLEELVVAASNSAAARTALLAALHRNAIARVVIARVLVSNEDIDDAEQRTLIAVASHVSTFEGRSTFLTWLYSVARNEALQVLRRKRSDRSDLFDELAEVGSAERLSSFLASQDALDRAMARLSAQEHRIIALRETDGLEYHDIAIALGIPLGTVRSRLARARARLGQHILDEI